MKAKKYSPNNIIHDFDGTLFDTYKNLIECFYITLKTYGIEEELSYEETLKLMSVKYRDAVEYFSKKYNNIEPTEFMHKAVKLSDSKNIEELKPIDGLTEFLEYTKNNGIKNYIVTHKRSNVVKDILEINNLSKYFSGVYSKHDGYKRKPDTDMFEKCMIENGVKPGDLSIGDRILDFVPSKAVGLKFCLMNTNNLKDIDKDIDFVVNNYTELKNKLTK